MRSYTAHATKLYMLGHVQGKFAMPSMYTTKTQIILRIRTVWSTPLLFAMFNLLY